MKILDAKKILCLIVLNTILLCGCTFPSKQVPLLSEEFLQGTWVREEGFVCKYQDKIFENSDGNKYFNCSIVDGHLESYHLFDDEFITKDISVIDNDTIKIDGITAVRSDSNKGKKYLKEIGEGLIGSWVTNEAGICYTLEINKDDIKLTSDEYDYTVLNYKFSDGAMLVYPEDEPLNESEALFLELSGDTLTWIANDYRLESYRKGSQMAEDAETGKLMLLGDWVYVTEDGKTISKWNFSQDSMLSMDGLDKEPVLTNVYITYIDKWKCYLRIGHDIYQFDYCDDRVYLYEEDSYDLIAMLYAPDSQEGNKYLDKVDTIFQEGEMITQTFSEEIKDERNPEALSIELTFDGMSNIWLEDYISLNKYEPIYGDVFSTIIHPYELICEDELDNAVISFIYNVNELPYDCEEDLVVTYFDIDNEILQVLDTSLNNKKHLVTAEFVGNGIYCVMDSLLISGDTRNSSEYIPKNTAWARNWNTGDILSLVDYDYIEESEGVFKVSTVSQLASVVYYANTTMNAFISIVLENNIDLSGYKWSCMGWSSGVDHNYPFRGIIDGQGYTISNLFIETKDYYGGLIGHGTYCNIYDLNITDAYISASSDAGIITAESICCDYSNCHVDGIVNASKAGSMIGYEANGYITSCTADVLVNGKSFDYLSWNEKEKSTIVVDELITITLEDDLTITRPDVDLNDYMNLGWVIVCDGEQLLDRNAENETSYKYFGEDPGNYEVYLNAFISGQYVPVSNVLSYTIN